MDGDNSNDYIIAQSLEYSWNNTGNTVITLKICDGINHCSLNIYQLKFYKNNQMKSKKNLIGLIQIVTLVQILEVIV